MRQQRTIILYDDAMRELWRAARTFGTVEELKGYLDECEQEPEVSHIQVIAPNGNIVGVSSLLTPTREI